jgi:sigma-E factor negative regulatory protein RseB
MRTRSISCCLALLWAVAAPAAQSEARAWIARMNTALATRNYDGWFRYQVAGQSQTLRLIHRMRDGQMTERLIFTDGSGSEFVRSGSEWLAYLPDKHMVLKETRNRSFGFITALNGLSDDSEKFYNIDSVGTTRLGSRLVQVVSVEPRDTLRYGYRFWLDQNSAMPLRTQLVTRTGEVIEEVSFINLSMPENISDDLLRPDVDTTGFRWMRRDVPANAPGVMQAFVPRADLLPAGFHVLDLNSPEDAAATGPKTRFIVSDGIAWVSVFVEVVDNKPRDLGPAQMGTQATYVARQDHYYISVVGEVPPQVVKSIAEAVRPE